MRTRLSLALLQILLLACAEDSTGPGEPAGGVRFTYSLPGAPDARYGVRGTPAIEGGRIGFGTGAAAGWGASSHDLVVVALDGRAPPLGDLFYFDIEQIPAARSGLEIDGWRVWMVLATGHDVRTLDDRVHCEMTSGRLDLTELTPTRIRGSFAAEGACTDASGRFVGSVTVTDGTLDLPVIPALDPDAR